MGRGAMAFEIYLPQARIAASQGLWAERLPIDDLDAAVRAAPERTAFVGRNSVLAPGDPPHLRRARRARRQDRGGARRARRRPRRRGRLPAAELVGVHGAVLRLQPHRRGRQSADADLPPARAALHDGLRRGQDRRRARAVARLRPHRHDARDPARPAQAAPTCLAVGGAGEESFEKAFLDRPARLRRREAEARQACGRSPTRSSS